MNQQVGNADTAPESENIQPDVDFDSDDFFESLDNSVNAGILDEPSQSTSNETSGNTQSSPSEVQQQSDGSDTDVLQKRYSDSSREAKRLNNKLQELEPYMPILEAMREDPNLITHVRNYFEGGGQTPQNMAEKLNLPEDFVFDADDAFSTPDSDSAKVLGATVDGIVSRRLNTALSGQKAENQRLTKETSFRQTHEMSDEEWSNFVDFAKSKSLELDDIYYLMNRNNRDEKIADNTRQEIQEKMRTVQDTPDSLATTGGTQVEESPDDRVFKAILGSDSELEEAFGM
tara:strand:+ start:128 stop:991 length:864 start_codon:yes stop_codon:yes gene_type:complete